MVNQVISWFLCVCLLSGSLLPTRVWAKEGTQTKFNQETHLLQKLNVLRDWIAEHEYLYLQELNMKTVQQSKLKSGKKNSKIKHQSGTENLQQNIDQLNSMLEQLQWLREFADFLESGREYFAGNGMPPIMSADAEFWKAVRETTQEGIEGSDHRAASGNRDSGLAGFIIMNFIASILEEKARNEETEDEKQGGDDDSGDGDEDSDSSGGSSGQ